MAAKDNISKQQSRSIRKKAIEISVKKKKRAIKRVKQTLGKGGKTFKGVCRGIKARVKMGQVSEEAVKKLERRKINQILNDPSLSPKAIEKRLRETLSEKTRKTIKITSRKIKSGTKNLYENTSKVAGNITKNAVQHPGIFIGNIVTTVGPIALPTTELMLEAQAISSASHIGTVSGTGLNIITKVIPVNKAVKDPKTGKKLRDANGKVVKRKIPLNKILFHWGKKAGKHIEDTFEGKGIKGSAKRMAEKVRESHHACHPQNI